MRRITDVLIILLIFAGSATARIINVPADYPTIQAGIEASVSGDTVLVAPGEYWENLNIIARNILLVSSHGPDTTSLRGDCRIREGVDSSCVVKGFTFLSPGGQVGSLIIVWPDVSPMIEGNIFIGGYSGQGGGIYSDGGTPIIRSNVIKENYARGAGGGIYLGNPFFTSRLAEVSYNIICRNRTGFSIYGEGHGGGIYTMVDVIMKYNVIYENRSEETSVGGYGGGIDREQAIDDHQFKTIMMNNTVVFNTAKVGGSHGYGGGLHIHSLNSDDSLIARNNIFAFNHWGGNVRGYLRDSIYFDWDYNLVYGDTSLHFPHGEHDIFLDPLFIDTLADDYHLLSGSPCIDAGDPLSPLDPDSTRADIGAYYFDQSVGIDEDGAPSGPYQFALKQNYPNPFNGQTIISYYLDKESTVSLLIFSITGHLVLPLLDKEVQDPGEHTYTWEGRDANGRAVSTGIYFYELYVNASRESKAMILIK